MDRRNPYTLRVTPAQFDAILAGLRMLATGLERGTVTPNDNDVGDILTCGGEHPGLTAAQVFDLGDAINGPDQSADPEPVDNDAQFPREDWQVEVRDGNTRLGYAEWVGHQREMDDGFAKG